MGIIFDMYKNPIKENNASRNNQQQECSNSVNNAKQCFDKQKTHRECEN